MLGDLFFLYDIYTYMYKCVFFKPWAHVMPSKPVLIEQAEDDKEEIDQEMACAAAANAVATMAAVDIDVAICLARMPTAPLILAQTLQRQATAGNLAESAGEDCPHKQEDQGPDKQGGAMVNRENGPGSFARDTARACARALATISKLHTNARSESNGTLQ